MEAIKTLALTKRYSDVTAVDALNLCVHRGELFSLLGVNGAGKTTTIKMLCGLTRPTSGDAELLGHSILTEHAQVQRLIGVSPQQTAVAPNLTVQENLELMGGVHGLSRDMQRSKAAELAGAFHLNELLHKKAGKLSGGWQRRLSLAMALVSDPEVLFLDEPTLGLDVLARSELWRVIRQLKGRVTIVLTTHYMEEAEALSDRTAIMAGGRLLALDTPAALMQKTGTARLEDAFLKIVQEAQI